MAILKKRLIAVMLGFLVTLISVLVATGVLRTMVVAELSARNQSIIEVLESILQDANQTLSTLNHQSVGHCTAETLQMMQRAMYNTRFIREIGFVVSEHVVCTTSQGLLQQPLQTHYANTIETPYNGHVHFDVPAALFSSADVVPRVLLFEQAHFYVAVDPSYINIMGNPPGHWQIIYRMADSGNHGIHVYGERGLYRNELLASKVNLFSLFAGAYQLACASGNRFCIASSMSAKTILKQYLTFIVLAGMMIIAVALACYRLLYPSERLRKSDKYRVRQQLGRGNFYCLYQPIVELSTNRVVGCEVLARYKDEFGAIFPDKFIPIIKKSRLTWQFTQLQIKSMINDLESIHLPAKFKISINIFPKDLKRENVMELIAMLRPMQHKFQFNLEIIEDRKLDTHEVRDLINHVVESGLLISIDDFGTGYSNLSQLKKIPCHYLKIDRSFVADIEKASLLSTLVPQIHTIAQRFNLGCIAEGIETAEQRDLIRQQGIEYGQGWYFGKPMTIQAFSSFFRSEENDESISEPRLSLISA